MERTGILMKHYFKTFGPGEILMTYKGIATFYRPMKYGKEYAIKANDDEEAEFLAERGYTEINPEGVEVARVNNNPLSSEAIELSAAKSQIDELKKVNADLAKKSAHLERVARQMLAPLTKKEIEDATSDVAKISGDVKKVLEIVSGNTGHKFAPNLYIETQADAAKQAAVEVIARSNRLNAILKNESENG
jgi:hypothetical protein